MKAILLANILHKGRRYAAGEELNLDAVTAGQYARAGLVHIEAAPKTPAMASDLSPVERKAPRAGKKACTSKKAARGQK
jgi:hypothetical protein